MAVLLPLALLQGGKVQAQSSETKSIGTLDKRMSAYPIPANNAVFIRLSPALKNEAKSIELISLIGRTVAQQNITGNEAGDIVFGGLSQLPEGVYISVTKNASGKILQTTKIAVQH